VRVLGVSIPGLPRRSESESEGRRIDDPVRLNDFMAEVKSDVAGAAGSMIVPAFYAGVTMAARMAASCPVGVVRRDVDGNVSPASAKLPLVKRVRQPNLRQTPFEFYLQLFAVLKSTGNAFVYIQREAGRPTQLFVLPPGTCAKAVDRNGAVKYRYLVDQAYSGDEWRTPDGTGGVWRLGGVEGTPYASLGGGGARPLPGWPIGQDILPADRVIHLQDVSLDGVLGLSPQGLHSRILCLAHAVTILMSNKVSSAGLMGGVLYLKEGATGGTTRLTDLRRQASASSPMMDMFLTSTQEVDFKQMASTLRDSGVLEADKRVISDVGRMLGISPALLGDERAIGTTRGLEEMLRQFVVTTIGPMHMCAGQALRQGLAPMWAGESRVLEVVWDTAWLTRPATVARTGYYKTMVETGAMSLNEVRRRENMPAIDDPIGDEHIRGLGGGMAPDRPMSEDASDAEREPAQEADTEDRT